MDLTRLDATLGIILCLAYIIYHRYFKTPFDSAAAPFVIRSLILILSAYSILIVLVIMFFFLD